MLQKQKNKKNPTGSSEKEKAPRTVTQEGQDMGGWGFQDPGVQDGRPCALKPPSALPPGGAPEIPGRPWAEQGIFPGMLRDRWPLWAWLGSYLGGRRPGRAAGF